MRVELSPEAEADIEEIGRFIGLENPGRAASFTRELIAACYALGRFPLAAPRVLHGRRDVERILFPTDP
jgi:plasmid stabilization system protein ParE